MSELDDIAAMNAKLSSSAVLAADPDPTLEDPNVRIARLMAELSDAAGMPVDMLMNAIDSQLANAPGAPRVLPEGTKVYYTSVPNCGIMVQKGSICERIEFIGNRLETIDPAAIAYLDEIADKPGHTIYTKSNAHIAAEVDRVRAEMFENAKIAHKKMLAAGEKVS